MIRLLLTIAALVVTHVGFKALWNAWLPMLSDPHPLLGSTVGAFFSNINRTLVAPMIVGWLDFTSRSPIYTHQIAVFARWIIGG